MALEVANLCEEMVNLPLKIFFALKLGTGLGKG